MLISTILLAAEDLGPNPIAPENKELFWGAGSFLVFLFVMRVFLVPKVKKGMDARYGLIRDGHESAQSMRAAAQGDVAAYEAAIAEVRAEAEGEVRVRRSRDVEAVRVGERIGAIDGDAGEVEGDVVPFDDDQRGVERGGGVEAVALRRDADGLGDDESAFEVGGRAGLGGRGCAFSFGSRLFGGRLLLGGLLFGGCFFGLRVGGRRREGDQQRRDVADQGRIDQRFVALYIAHTRRRGQVKQRTGFGQPVTAAGVICSREQGLNPVGLLA